MNHFLTKQKYLLALPPPAAAWAAPTPLSKGWPVPPVTIAVLIILARGSRKKLDASIVMLYAVKLALYLTSCARKMFSIKLPITV